MTLTRNTPAPLHRLRRTSCYRTTQRKREKIPSCRFFLARLRASEVVRESDAGEDSRAKRWRGAQPPQDHPLRRRRAKPDEGRR